MTNAPQNLSAKYLFLTGPEAVVVEEGPAIWTELMSASSPASQICKRLTQEDGFLVIEMTVTPDSGKQFELHPNGDELLMLIEGSADIVLEFESGTKVCSLRRVGDVCRIPRGTWHTQRLPEGVEKARIVGMTAGRGTQHDIRE
uniref:Cupin 2 conserved barrel domain-containing protein n=1 Tax=Chromera velia CCMP2878 TaxID=1169474 RepID=A0A0G4I220_9ALVE|eukprot:Cvel_10259.t1-p1 / transcript=Cvel_10259.t1 / gene=Cvel_10259 / organism=Chromera_velia_CCMP2878 / gene_product=hypothetical protein / transcript_product=hypothetical protein / location=Cvel_scaffold615:25962-26390(-) / protein_length=143 / sequence_SO=supercontig / SO=protein_coding / is_pseudo=false